MSLFYQADAHGNDSTKIRYEIIPNHGQWHPAARYKIPIKGGEVFLNSDGITYQLYHPDDYNRLHVLRHDQPTKQITGLPRKHVVKLKFLQMEYAPRITETQRLKHYYNYYLGSDKDKWASKVHPATEVLYKNVYQGIDLRVNTQSGLKYEWVMEEASHELVQQIQCEIQGADSLAIIDKKLYIYTSTGTIIEDAPIAYQEIGYNRSVVDCNYNVNNNILSYELNSDLMPGARLIIDPKLIFSTYSGSLGDNFGYTATYDSRGSLYAGGIVDNLSGEYPVTTGAYDTTWNGGIGREPVYLACDISISKYDSAGNNLLWASYLGGSDDEYPHSLVVDRNDDLILYGTTYSANYPFTKSALDTTHAGGTDIIISKLSSDGTTLMASTFVGGSGDDGLVRANSALQHNYADNFRGDVIPDDDLHIFVASSTSSSNILTENAFQSTLQGPQDAFLFELNQDLSEMIWGTYLGGSGLDAAYSIKLDQFNNICIGGGSASDELPTTDSVFQKDRSASVDGYIGVIDKTSKQIKYLSYYGTNSYDQIYFIDIDNKGSIYATGQTEGSITKTSGTYGDDNRGQFIFKIDTALRNMEWQTTFGNTDNQINLAPSAFLVDVCEHIYFSGWGSATGPRNPGSTEGMPITPDAEQSTTDNNDFYIIVLDKNATGLLYATFFGGDETEDHVDGGTSRFDKRGVIYQSVCSSCPGPGEGGMISDFPTSPNAFSTTNPSIRCSNASFKIDLQIKTAVVADFVAEPTIGCAPFEVSFTNKSVLGDEWLWDFGDGVTSTVIDPKHTYSEPGLYEVTLTVIDSNTCNISDVYRRNILVIDQGKAIFDVKYDRCSDELIIDNRSERAYSYAWDFGDGTTSTDENPEHFYDEDGFYTIKLLINEDSYCSDTISSTIKIEKLGDQDFKLYNVFTPNNDDLNDCFRFDGLETFCEGIEWKVYNRWGELVFQTTDPNACWDGTLPNSEVPLPESEYFYILNLNPEKLSSKNLISGTITLIR